MAKRSLAQRLKERAHDLDAAERDMSRGKAPPKIGRATRPASSTYGKPPAKKSAKRK